MSNEEYYRLLYELPEVSYSWRALLDLPRETRATFRPQTAHLEHSKRLHEKVIKLTENTSDINALDNLIQPKLHFHYYTSRFQILLNDIRVFQSNLTHFNIDWTKYKYLIDQAYRDEALLCRYHEV